MKALRLTAIVVMIYGCSSAPTEQEVDVADFGLSMTEAECLAVAKPFITLKWVILSL